MRPHISRFQLPQFSEEGASSQLLITIYGTCKDSDRVCLEIALEPKIEF